MSLNKVTGNTLRGYQKYWVLLSAATAFKYFRFYMTASGNPYAGYSEIYFYDSGQAEISKSGMTASDNYHTASYTASNTLDGVAVTSGATTSVWSPNHANSVSSPSIVFYNMNGSKTVKAIAIWTIADNWQGVGSNAYLGDFYFQFSNDDTCVIGDAVDSTKWFGVDLINGDFSGANGWGGTGLLGANYTYYLFQDGSNIRSYATGSWVTVGTAPATQAMFTANGMPNLSNINNAAIQALASNTVEVLISTNTGKTPSATLPVTVPDKLIKANGDIDIGNVVSLNNVLLSYITAGSGNIRVIASIDSGTTWQTWDGANWVVIDSTNLPLIATNGIAPTVLNALTTANWTSLISGATTIRLAYFLSMAASTDTALTSYINFTMDMLGYWSKALHGTDYTYAYIKNDTLRFDILTSGDYKINY